MMNIPPKSAKNSDKAAIYIDPPVLALLYFPRCAEGQGSTASGEGIGWIKHPNK